MSRTEKENKTGMQDKENNYEIITDNNQQRQRTDKGDSRLWQDQENL